ncbi:MAG: ABC transporter ATP-binding protein [Bacillota bacterium]
MSVVILRHVDKYYGKVKAVNNVTVEIKDGEFISLLGPSGCGKTTTLRCIAGLEKPDSGDIYLDDRRINNLPPRERDLAMVFQSYALYPHFKVFDNIAYPLRIRKMPEAEVEKKVKDVAATLRIENYLDRLPKQLSGGERQRVALGRALVRSPKVFLLDEPLSNVDALLRLHMRAELKRLQNELAITTICVTHDQTEAMTMSDRIAVMRGGVVQQVGTPDQIYNEPVNRFVASFVGTPPMNFIEGVLDRGVDGNTIRFNGSKLRYVNNSDVFQKRAAKLTSSEVIVGIRPEDIRVSLNQPNEDAVSAEIYVLEPLGSEVIVDLKFMGNILKARADNSLKAKLGDKIWLSVNTEKLHLFDKTTEEAIC